MFSLEMIERLPEWFCNTGPHADCVISTRVRLARNLIDRQFPFKASLLERKKIFGEITEAINKVPQCKDFATLNFSQTDKVNQQFLFENRVVSRDLITLEGDRGVVYDFDKCLSIMVNEEDHIRMHCMSAGCQPDEAWKSINALDDELGKHIRYAFDTRWGFLTTCPTNSGTGFRISFLMHLPGLVLTKSINSVLSGASQMGMSVRGFLGESSDVIGNFFQLSNQATMGANEEQFIQDAHALINRITGYEREARERILKDAKTELTDKIYRSYGILKHARTLAVDEFLNLTSALRLGIECKIITGMDIITLNRMILLCLPAHMELFFKKSMDEETVNIVRADLIKKFLPII